MLEHWRHVNGLQGKAGVRVRPSCTTQLAACGGEPSNRLQVLAGVMCQGSPATGCMRRPTGAVARQAPHARRKLPVHCESLETSASRPVTPHSAHGARAQLGLSSTVRMDGPAPGCPSDASSAVHEPVCASFAARQPTQRARRASPVRRSDDCSKRSPGAQMPVTQCQCPM